MSDPRTLGALCDRCPLCKAREGQPVPTEHRMAARAIAVGQEPGRVEVRTARPLSGPSGMLFDQSLGQSGASRFEVSTTSAVLCAPPGDNLKNYEKKVAEENKLRAARGEQEWLLPSEACRPRLLNEISTYENWIGLGAVALKALAPQYRGSLDRYRGRTFTVEGLGGRKHKLLPTYNPAHLLRDGIPLRPVFVEDLRRAWRFFSDNLSWTEPELFYQPTLVQIEDLLLRRTGLFLGARTHFWDVETDSIRAMKAKLQCVGVGTADWAVNIPVLGIDGKTTFYSQEELQQIGKLLYYWASAKSGIVKAGWNSGMYDRLVFESTLGIVPEPYIDGILLKRSASPSLPHDLGFSGSFYTDVHNWKGDFWGKGKDRTDRDEWEYNLKDVVVTARVMDVLSQKIEQRKLWKVVQVDHVNQAAGAGMHRLGMPVDELERRRLEAMLVSPSEVTLWNKPLQRDGTPHPKAKLITLPNGKMHTHLLNAKKIIDAEARGLLDLKRCADDEGSGLSEEEEDEGWVMPDAEDLGLRGEFNPLSHAQLRRILFDAWGLSVPATMKPKEAYTSSGEPSTSDAVLRNLIISKQLKRWQHEFVTSVRLARRQAKIFGTYVRAFRMPVGDKKLDRGAVCWLDGRLHPNWNVHTAITGRYATSGPNAQNMTELIKMLIVALDGMILVGGDQDQLELRVAAARWGAQAYLDAFKSGIDPHQMTMQGVFGRDAMMKFKGAPQQFGDKHTIEKASQFDTMRKLSKMLQYACLEKGTKIAVLGPEREKAIEQMKPGDWTWAWSRQRARYEAARITDVINNGVRECVEVEFEWWGGAKGGRRTGKMVLTADHLCLLRDGQWRQAGDLRPNDALMPFRRREISGRNYVMPYNTDYEVSEHRVVKGLYDRDSTVHVHHLDENIRNNHPENLAFLTPDEHIAEHQEGLAEARRGSDLWRSSVSNPETRSKASKKMWERYHEDVDAGRRVPRAKQIKSKLDPYRQFMGHNPDDIVALIAGCTTQGVAYYRKTRGIPAYWREAPKGSNHAVVAVRPVGPREVWDLTVDHEDHNFALASGVFVHNSQYGATLETVFRLITAAEDKETGALHFAHLTLDQVGRMHENWLRNCPEFKSGWKADQAFVREHGWIAEPIHGRRRDFLEPGTNLSEEVNFCVQASAAAIMNDCLAELVEQIPFDHARNIGLINQCHDSLTFHVPISETQVTTNRMTKVMNRSYSAYPGVSFTCEVKDGYRWGET